MTKTNGLKDGKFYIHIYRDNSDEEGLYCADSNGYVAFGSKQEAIRYIEKEFDYEERAGTEIAIVKIEKVGRITTPDDPVPELEWD